MPIGQTPILHDSDVDTNLPPEIPDADAAGFISTLAMQPAQFDLFRASVE
jgi:hypothetical protein